jgi:hypothetical protein
MSNENAAVWLPLPDLNEAAPAISEAIELFSAQR